MSPDLRRGIEVQQHRVRVLARGGLRLESDLALPADARGLVLIADPTGNHRQNLRCRYGAEVLNQAGLATLALDLITREEMAVDHPARTLRLDVARLAERIHGATEWLVRHPSTGGLRIGVLAHGAAAAAALIAAADHPEQVAAVVSCGGQPELAGDALEKVRAPTLLIACAENALDSASNEYALAALRCDKRLMLMPCPAHLFEHPTIVEWTAEVARDWFVHYLVPATAPGPARHQMLKEVAYA